MNKAIKFFAIGWLSWVISIAQAACPQPKDFALVEVQANIAIVCHDDWTSYYDTASYVPSFVFYTITAEHTQAPQVKRPSNFVTDPSLSEDLQAKSSWFAKSGYDRGHMFPNEDGNYDTEVVRRTFYMTNVAAQTPQLNRGIWSSYEESTRNLALQHGKVTVYIRAIYKNQPDGTKDKSMAIPSEFIKIVVYDNVIKMYKFTNTSSPQVDSIDPSPENVKQYGLKVNK